MTLPQYTKNSILAYHTLTDELSASQNESATIPKWLQILGSDPTKLAMFAATQLRWIPSFIEGVKDSEKIYSGEITSLTFNGRGVIADQVLVQVLSVLVQACHMPFEGLFGKPSNIELANEKTRRAVIRYSDEVFIEFKIGKNNTITAQAQGMNNFDFPQQEVLKQIKEHGSRFMSSTGLVFSTESLANQKFGQSSVLISPKLIDVMIKAVSEQTTEHLLDGRNENPKNNNAKKNPIDSHYQISNDNNISEACSGALRCINNLKPSSLHSSTAPVSSEERARINCSPYLLGNMINAVYNVQYTIENQASACVA